MRLIHVVGRLKYHVTSPPTKRLLVMEVVLCASLLLFQVTLNISLTCASVGTWECVGLLGLFVYVCEPRTEPPRRYTAMLVCV
jgi:hypothetical protein